MIVNMWCAWCLKPHHYLMRNRGGRSKWDLSHVWGEGGVNELWNMWWRWCWRWGWWSRDAGGGVLCGYGKGGTSRPGTNGNGAVNGGSESSACEYRGFDGQSWSFWLFPAHCQSGKWPHIGLSGTKERKDEGKLKLSEEDENFRCLG